MSLPMFTCVVQEAMKILPHMASPVFHSCHYQHSFADLTNVLLPFCIFYFFLSPLFCCTLLFFPAHCNVLSAHHLFFCFSSQPCWRDQLPLGNDFILPPEKPTPKCFFSNTPWILGIRNSKQFFFIPEHSWAVATQQGSKQAHIKSTPTEKSSPEASVPSALVIITAYESCISHLIVSLSAVPSPHLAKKCVLSQTLTTRDKNFNFTFLLSSSHNQLIDK